MEIHRNGGADMRRIAIIGSGIVGLITAHGLRRAGYHVTLYSDRTAEQWLRESRPTGTAARFDLALTYERALGLNHWDDVAPRGEGVFLTFCPTRHNQLVRLLGRSARPFQAVDMRLQIHRWMNDFEDHGGDLAIESVTVDRLDAITAAHDLTLVAAGKAELARLFERDALRSAYDAPKRHLAMVIATGRMSVDGCPFLPVKFEFLGTDGEIFFVPYLHRDAGPSWNIVIEAQPGSRIDRYADAKSGDEVLALTKQLVRELFPWSDAWMQTMKLADPMGWLTGRIAPTVRKPIATLRSGRVVAALGDTAITYDPVAAQGANSGVKQARHLVESIVARGDRPFDAAWIAQTFDAFWNDHARWACAFNNLFLEPLTAAGQQLLIAQYGSDGRADNESGRQHIADAFFANFNDPRELTPAFLSVDEARAFIAKTTGHSWLWSLIRGGVAVARDQLRQRLVPRLECGSRSYRLGLFER
jgi:2-polyprenyl-6-methoxyphenol hydroxylase-like FAD-dependent oxidoreductase